VLVVCVRVCARVRHGLTVDDSDDADARLFIHHGIERHWRCRDEMAVTTQRRRERRDDDGGEVATATVSRRRRRDADAMMTTR